MSSNKLQQMPVYSAEKVRNAASPILKKLNQQTQKQKRITFRQQNNQFYPNKHSHAQLSDSSSSSQITNQKQITNSNSQTESQNLNFTSEDDSMDFIEAKIKQLEEDLQARLNARRQESHIHPKITMKSMAIDTQDLYNNQSEQVNPSKVNEATNVYQRNLKNRQKLQQKFELQKKIQLLKKDNELLKMEIQRKKQNHTQNHQVRVLKQLLSDRNSTKVEKQLQLLKVLDKLQRKLRKSIQHKLSSHKGTVIYEKPSKVRVTNYLMHKGVPSSYLQ